MTSRVLPDVVSFAAVLFAGLVGGLLFGTALEQRQLNVLDASAWLAARQEYRFGLQPVDAVVVEHDVDPAVCRGRITTMERRAG